MSAFEELLAVARDRSLPPVADWQPQRTGEIDIRIASNGDWYHEGTLVKRFAIARLFATILRVDDGAHYLVTPVEKLRIEVEDAPFIATDFETDGEDEQRRIVFATNVGDAVLADAAHPITVEGPVDAPRPYVSGARRLAGADRQSAVLPPRGLGGGSRRRSGRVERANSLRSRPGGSRVESPG